LAANNLMRRDIRAGRLGMGIVSGFRRPNDSLDVGFWYLDVAFDRLLKEG
jgi:hypothetical protein